MINSFLLSFSVVCPLFLMMSLGYFLYRVGLFQEEFLKQLNKVCFQVFLPLILYWNVYNSDFSKAFQPGLVLFGMACVTVMFLMLMVAVPLLEKDNARRGVVIQGIFRSNFILFGIPVAESLFGAEHGGVTAILIAFVVPLYNILAVVALETFQGGRIDGRRICRGAELGSLFIMLASPTAVSSFTMAQQMSGDSELAGQIVVVSSLLSVLTVFCGIFLLNQMGMLIVTG